MKIADMGDWSREIARKKIPGDVLAQAIAAFIRRGPLPEGFDVPEDTLSKIVPEDITDSITTLSKAQLVIAGLAREVRLLQTLLHIRLPDEFPEPRRF